MTDDDVPPGHVRWRCPLCSVTVGTCTRLVEIPTHHHAGREPVQMIPSHPRRVRLTSDKPRAKRSRKKART